MLFNDMCNNLHKKNANYRKKCIFLVQITSAHECFFKHT